VTLLERVKERVETDLSDPELQRMIDEALIEIIQRYGPHADSTKPITVLLPGGFPSLFPLRPVDETNTVEIVESIGTTETTLASNDYRAWHGGRRLERLATGNNPAARWGDSVRITYTPANDGNQREEVAIKLVDLSLSYRGLIKGDRVGDTTESLTSESFVRERDALLASLSPTLRLA
jgi:hypothetical protein